jgi:hypothetical protein
MKVEPHHTTDAKRTLSVSDTIQNSHRRRPRLTFDLRLRHGIQALDTHRRFAGWTSPMVMEGTLCSGDADAESGEGSAFGSRERGGGCWPGRLIATASTAVCRKREREELSTKKKKKAQPCVL